MKTKNLIYSLLVFLTTTNALFATTSFNTNTDDLEDFPGPDINDLNIRYCWAVEPHFTFDGRWIDGCGNEVPNPFDELIAEKIQ